METLAVVCALLAGVLSISELPIFKRLEFLESDRGKKIRVTLIVGLLALGTLFQQLAQRESERKREQAEASRDQMLGALGKGMGALTTAQADQAAEKAARLEAERREREDERRREAAEAAHAQRTARLDIAWSPLGGRRLEPARLTAPVDVSGRAIADRKEYLLTASNPSDYSIIDVDMLFQFPYPVSSRDVSRTVDAVGVAFEPDALTLTAVPIGSGTARVGPACAGSYLLTVGELQPRGRVEVLVRLFSGRDPRGREPIDEKQRQRFSVPEWGPTRTFVRGRYKYAVGGSRITRQFYAPLELRDDKTVLLARPLPPPPSAKLMTSAVMDFACPEGDR